MFLVSIFNSVAQVEEEHRRICPSKKLSKDVILSGASPEQAAEEVNKIVVAVAKKLGVKVNPKYGTWNADTASIESGDITDGAVTPAP